MSEVDKWSPSIDDIYSIAQDMLAKKASGYSVRKASKDDIESIVYINRKCLPENYPVYFFEELLERYGEAFYVATAPDDQVVGYVMCRVEWKPGFFNKWLLRSLHIVSIAVLPEHRRKGLGYALMAHALKSGKEVYHVRETYLEVRVSNSPAISLYKKLGYKVVKTIAHYYLDGEDAYLMARPL